MKTRNASYPKELDHIASEIEKEDLIKVLKAFALNLAQIQVDIDPEFTKVLDEHFWELIE